MERNDRSLGWVGVAGVVLVVIGAVLLLDRALLPILGPFAAVLRAAGHLLWPIALILAGVALLAGGTGMSAERRAIAGVHRSRTDRVVGGVLGGVADRVGFDATLVRIAFVVLTVITGVWAGIVFYVVAALLLPEAPVSAAQPVAPPPVPPIRASAAPTPPGVPGE